jgi:hypothetical protein
MVELVSSARRNCFVGNSGQRRDLTKQRRRIRLRPESAGNIAGIIGPGAFGGQVQPAGPQEPAGHWRMIVGGFPV